MTGKIGEGTKNQVVSWRKFLSFQTAFKSTQNMLIGLLRQQHKMLQDNITTMLVGELENMPDAFQLHHVDSTPIERTRQKPLWADAFRRKSSKAFTHHAI